MIYLPEFRFSIRQHISNCKSPLESRIEKYSLYNIYFISRLVSACLIANYLNIVLESRVLHDHADRFISMYLRSRSIYQSVLYFTARRERYNSGEKARDVLERDYKERLMDDDVVEWRRREHNFRYFLVLILTHGREGGG